jgi:hypothetical protein
MFQFYGMCSLLMSSAPTDQITLCKKRQVTVIRRRWRTRSQYPQWEILYTLFEAGFLTVLEEHQKRGTVERVYGLQEKTFTFLPSDLAQVPKEEYRRFFAAIIASLQNDVNAYLQQGSVDIVADHIGYNQLVLDLNEEELQRLIANVSHAIRESLPQQAKPGRRRYVLTLLFLPGDVPPL